MAVLFTNNAQAALSATITAAATSFSVAAGLGALFPSPGVGDHFFVTLADTAGNLEIVKVTARNTDTFTVVRGQDGTTAQAYSAGDKVELRLTKAMLDQIKLDTQQNIAGNLSFTGTGNRITGDFTNATYANRVLVQTSTVNGNTFFGLIPNGTAVNAQFQVFNSSDPANSALATFTAASQTVRLVSSATGTGTTLPIVVVFGSAEAARFATNGNFLLGSQTDNGTDRLQVTGSANITGALKQGGNQVLHAGNYTDYALSTSGGTLSSTVDGILTLNKSSGTAWNYINFSVAGTRRFYFGLNASYEPELGVDNGATFRVNGAMTVGGNTVVTSGNYSSYALPLSGGTLTGKMIAGSSNGDSIEVRNDTASSASSGYITFKNKNSSGVYRPAARISGANVDNAFDGDFLIETYSGGVAYKGLRVDENSDVWFYDTSGNAKFQWDAVNSRALINSNVVLHAGNYSSYALPLSGGTITGTTRIGNLSIGYGTYLNSIRPTGDTNLNLDTPDGATYATNIFVNYNQVLHAGNYSNYALNRAGDTMSNVLYFRGNKGNGSYLGANVNYALQAYADDGGAAALSFHRGGSYAVNLGLDPDNVLRIGGWSANSNRWQLDMSGNNTVAGSVTSGGNGGFINDVYYGGARNPIWRFGNADGYGLSYFQGTAGIGGADTIGFHFGTATAAASHFAMTPTAAYVNNNVVLHAGNYSNYVLPIGGGWYATNLPGSRWGGYAVNGGEIVFGRDLPNTSQMGILVDGCYVAGENNGFWSLPGDNNWNNRRGMYWDGSYLNLSTNDPTVGVRSLIAGNNWNYDNPGGWNANIVASGIYHGRVRIKASSYNGSGDHETYMWVDNTVSPATGIYSTKSFFNFMGGITTVQIAGNSVLHAGNYTSFSGVLRAGGNNDGMDLNTLAYNTMYYAYIANSNNRPGSYSYPYGTVLTFDPGQGAGGRAQFYISHAGNDLIFRGGWNGNDSWQTWNKVLTDQNYSSYALPLSGGTMTGRLYHNEWIQFNYHNGLYSPQNSAHLFPNDGSYGSWKIYGTRNGWAGLNFGNLNNGDVALMVYPNSNETGFLNAAYGWQFRWNNGTAYVHKNTYGGGTEATVLDSSNYTNYTDNRSVSNVNRVKTFFIDSLAADGTQSRRYEVARIAIDYNDWNAVGSFEIELHEISWSSSIKKRYTVNYGYSGTQSISLSEMTGVGANYFRAAIGSPVQVSGDHYYLPVYVDVGYYVTVAARITTSRNISNDTVPPIGSAKIFTSPSGSNISDHGADSVVNLSSSASAITLGGNTLLHAGNYSSYALPIGGGTLTGSRPITFNTGNGWMYAQGNSGGWAMGHGFYGSSGTFRGGFGALGGGDGLTYFFVGADYNDASMTWTYSDINAIKPITLGGRSNSSTFGGNTSGMSGNAFVAEVRASGNKPTLTFHYENVATTHIEHLSDGSLNVWRPSNEGTSVFKVGGNSALHAGNYTDYVPISTDGGANKVLKTASNGYLYLKSWIDVAGSGLFSTTTNGSHWYPSDSTFGSWKAVGTRNGWNGIAFGSLNNGEVTLMVGPNSNETGFYNPAYGWQIYWTGGTLYNYKNSYGGGTQAVVLDSSNYTNYGDGRYVLKSGDTMSGTLQLNSLSNSIIAQHDGTGTYWRGRIISRNSDANRAVFLGNYNSKIGLFAHTNALDGWAPLYLNTLGDSGGSTVYLPHNATYTMDSSNNTYAVLNTGNYSGYALALSGGSMTGTISSYRSDTQRLFASYNTSASSPLQFYIDHSYGSVNIGNARGTINFATSGGLFHGGNTILTGANVGSYALALSGGTMTGGFAISNSNGYIRLVDSENGVNPRYDKTGIQLNKDGNSIYVSTSVTYHPAFTTWAPTGSQLMVFRQWSTNSEFGNISINGSGVVQYNTTSDYRLKADVVEVSGSGERLDALNPVEYTWIANGSRARGFLAHEFQQVYESSVTGAKDAVDAEGRPKYQAMQAGSAEVIADLVSEIQSLRKRMAEKDEAISSLIDRVLQLESK